MSTHNIGFYGELEKIIPELSSTSPLYYICCLVWIFVVCIWKSLQSETSKMYTSIFELSVVSISYNSLNKSSLLAHVFLFRY